MFMFSAIEGASLHTKTFYDLTGSEGRVALAAFCLLPKVTGVVVPGPPPRKPKTAAEVHQNIEKQLLAQLAPPAELSLEERRLKQLHAKPHMINIQHMRPKVKQLA